MKNQIPPQNITVIDQDKGEYFGVMGDNYRIVVSGNDTNGEFAIMDMVVPPGGGPAPHAHSNIRETFFVIEGELLYKTENGHVTVKAGGFVDVPKGGAVHCFKNISDKNARVICTVSPAGLEEFFKEFGEPVKPNEFLPIPEFTPDFVENLNKLNEKYGQVSFSPDYLD